MTISKLKQSLCVGLFLVVPPLGQAQGNFNPLIISPGTGPLFSGNSVTVGCVFTVGYTPITITALGIFDSGPVGLEQSHSVGLWTIDGSFLESVSFQPGTSDISLNGFLYQNVTTQYTLPVGTTWVLGAYYPSGTSDLVHVNSSGDQAEVWSSSAAHFIQCRYTSDESGFTFPASSASGLSYVGPNILYTIPEPTTLNLSLFCGLAMAFLRSGFVLAHRNASSVPTRQ